MCYRKAKQADIKESEGMGWLGTIVRTPGVPGSLIEVLYFARLTTCLLDILVPRNFSNIKEIHSNQTVRMVSDPD